ncbi:MAG TPA: histidine phosphatase family protein [Polyangiaceae bacterium]|nr:histidine phosphatase family protein [Polyangiaceae bacterium]
MGTIYLIRHGQASFGAADYDRLSDLGVTQSAVLGRALLSRRPRTDRIVSGTMLRHHQTAEACLEAMGLPRACERDSDWNEYDHQAVLRVYDPRYADPGTMAAELASSEDPRRRFQEIFVASMRRWVSGRHDTDYAESWPSFRGRVNGALARLNTSLAKSQGALVFTSGGPIAAICSSLLNLAGEDALHVNSKLANASVTKLVCSTSTVHLSTLNEHAHFEGGEGSLITYR